MKRQFFLGIIAFIMCLSAVFSLYACGSEQGNDAQTTAPITEPEATDEVIDGVVIIDEKGESAFTIVRAEHAEGYVKKCASDLYMSLKKSYPESGIKVRDDFLIRDEQPGEYEIIVRAARNLKLSLRIIPSVSALPTRKYTYALPSLRLSERLLITLPSILW